MTLPLIAVAGRALPEGRVRGWRMPGVGVPAAYVRALGRAGAQEAILQPLEIDAAEAARRLERFDGLLLVGGGDVDPGRYGEEPHDAVYGVDAELDTFELALARAAVDRSLPTLAVCRGIQVLNVALGGTLDQHLPGAMHGDPGTHRPVPHEVALEPGSLVALAMGVERAEVSSHHHQAPARLGRGLRPSGRAPDGVVEAVEGEAGWLVGVQWHPEHTAQEDPVQQRLFDVLVREAAAAR